MKIRLFAVAAALWLGCEGASAAITCSTITSPGFTLYYDSNGSTLVQSSFTVTCNRASPTDFASLTYSVEADNGIHTGSSGQNQAQLAGNNVNYEAYKNSSCSAGSVWDNSGFTDTITWAAGATGTLSKTTSFWACAPNGQTGKPAGTYTDTIGMRFRGGASGDFFGSFAVAIVTPAICTVTVPANLNFNYTAFGPLVNSSTTFAVNCNSGMPYSMAVSPTTGTVIGLDYVLSFTTPNQTGSGAAQTQTINGTMAAGQAGLCAGSSCSGSQPHTVTITY